MEKARGLGTGSEQLVPDQVCEEARLEVWGNKARKEKRVETGMQIGEQWVWSISLCLGSGVVVPLTPRDTAHPF